MFGAGSQLEGRLAESGRRNLPEKLDTLPPLCHYEIYHFKKVQMPSPFEGKRVLFTV